MIGNQFDLSAQALAKVEGDVFELLEAAALWNACASWNEFMDTGTWHSHAFQKPHGAIPTSYRKIAAIWLPRGYDTTKLFNPDVRNRVRAFEHALERRDMELGLSAPDLVGVRLPSNLSPKLQPLRHPLDNLDEQNHYLLEHMYKNLEGTLSGSDFLFAVAVKRTTRSDRLYQPLFEANVLKYLIESVLAGSAFRFYVHMGSMAGADVSGRYRAASLVSLLRGGSEFSRAVNSSYHAERPISAAQSVLDDFTLFPI